MSADKPDAGEWAESIVDRFMEAAIMAAITESLIEQNAPDSVSIYPIMDKVIAALERGDTIRRTAQLPPGAGAKAEPAPPAPPAAPDLADYQEWWSRQIPNNFKHESAVAIAYAQSKLARAESELEKLREALGKAKAKLDCFRGLLAKTYYE